MEEKTPKRRSRPEMCLSDSDSGSGEDLPNQAKLKSMLLEMYLSDTGHSTRWGRAGDRIIIQKME